MNPSVSNFISPRIMYCGLGFAVTALSGFALSHFGRPLNSAIFTVHKLIAVATIILAGVSIRDLYRSAVFQALYPALIGVTVLFLVALLVSGALLSFDKLATAVVLRVHQFAPVLAAGLATFTIYLLASDNA